MIPKVRVPKVVVQILLLLACSSLGHPSVFAASASASLQRAKQEAEAKGYAFFTNRDEIVSKAKKEGKARVIIGGLGGSPTLKFITEAFRKKYPFVDLYMESIKSGEGGAQQNLLEVKAGAAKDWDIVRTYTDFYSEYLPYLWKIDLLGMAEHGVLAIPPKMIDPKQRNILAIQSQFAVTAYNKDLISPSQLPKSWEDILKPEFKGRKFALDIRPQEIAALVPEWGQEKTLEFARKLAAQQPIWSRGGSRTLVSMAAGEFPMFVGVNYDTLKRNQRKDAVGVIQYTVLEPAPVRISSEHAIMGTSRNPHAALLWLEFMAGPEAQHLIDEHEVAASLYVRGSAAEQELRGKQVSVVSWEQNQNMEQWVAKIFETFGFPRGR